jgi:hypothetical protein
MQVNDKPDGPNKPSTPDMGAEAREFMEKMKSLANKVGGNPEELKTAVASVSESNKHSVSREELGGLTPTNTRHSPSL